MHLVFRVRSSVVHHPGLYRVLDSDDVRFVNLQMQFYAASNSMMYEVHAWVSQWLL